MQPLTNFQQFCYFLLNPKKNLESLILNWPSPQNVNTALQVRLTSSHCKLSKLDGGPLTLENIHVIRMILQNKLVGELEL